MSSLAAVDPATRLLQLEDFALLVGASFTLAEQATVLTLAEARATGEPCARGHRQPFDLTFRATASQILPQGSYRFHHDALGTAEIFIVPIAIEDGTAVYQAIFS